MLYMRLIRLVQLKLHAHDNAALFSPCLHPLAATIRLPAATSVYFRFII